MSVVTAPSVPAAFSTSQLDHVRIDYFVWGSPYAVTFDLTAIPAGAVINSAYIHCEGVYHGNVLSQTPQVSGGVYFAPFPPDYVNTPGVSMVWSMPLAAGSYSAAAFVSVNDHVYLSGSQQAVKLQAAFGTTLSMTYAQTWPSQNDAVFGADVSLLRLTIDYTWTPGVVLANSYIYPMKRRDNVQYLFFTAPYPNGYHVGLDVTNVSPPPDGKHYDIVSSRSGLLAVITGNTLRLYGANATELVEGTATGSVDICRVIF